MAFHGVHTSEQATSIGAVTEALSGIPFVVGTAPVQMVGGKANEIIFAQSYKEAVEQLGYSDDWDNYSLCEVIYSHFQLYKKGPVVFVNVLDKETNKEKVNTVTQYSIQEKQLILPLEVIADTLVLQNDQEGTKKYVKGKDYETFYDSKEQCLVAEIVEGGAIEEEGLTAVYADYYMIAPAQVTKEDIIGGYNLTTGETTGLELIDYVFAKYLVIPDLILAPGYSHDPEVAAIMSAKAEAVNGLFPAKALIDADTETTKKYSDVPAWRNGRNITSKEQQLYWPMVKLGDRVFHQSVQQAGLIAQTDAENGGCPSQSQSNHKIQADGVCLKDGTEVLLTLNQANYLNENGITTVNNFIGGLRSWGNYTAAYPVNTDPKDMFLAVSRTFAWVAKNFILNVWAKVDQKMIRRSLQSIKDTFNIYLNGLTNAEKILGGRIELLEEENPETSLLAGKVKFHVYLGVPIPNQEIEAVFEMDTTYLQTLFAA